MQSVRAAGWMVCVALSLAIIFGLIGINNYTVDPEDQDLGGFGNFLYGGFVFPLWGLCVGWVVLLCTLGLAGELRRKKYINQSESIKPDDFKSIFDQDYLKYILVSMFVILQTQSIGFCPIHFSNLSADYHTWCF